MTPRRGQPSNTLAANSVSVGHTYLSWYKQMNEKQILHEGVMFQNLSERKMNEERVTTSVHWMTPEFALIYTVCFETVRTTETESFFVTICF